MSKAVLHLRLLVCILASSIIVLDFIFADALIRYGDLQRKQNRPSPIYHPYHPDPADWVLNGVVIPLVFGGLLGFQLVKIVFFVLL